MSRYTKDFRLTVVVAKKMERSTKSTTQPTN